MLLTQLTLHNVGPFAGQQMLELAPPSPEQPIVLIGGMNGCGKTTILEAVLLALYGKLSPAARDAGVGYDEYLRRLINRNAHRSEACIELDFRSRQEGSDETYRVTRSWSARGSGIRERLDVQIAGRYDPVLSEHWQERVESFLPVRLSKLFFFDGERIESLADPRRAPEVISAAIHALLGIDIVAQLEADLALLERRKAKEQQSEVVAQSIEALETELSALSSRRSDLRQSLAGMIDPCRRAEVQLERLESQFRHEGGEVAARRQTYERDLLSVEEELTEVRRQMIHLAAGPLPLLFVRDQLVRLLTQVTAEQNVSHALATVQVLQERDARVIAELKAARLSEPVIRKVELLLERHRSELLTADPIERRLDLNRGTADQIQRLVDQALDEQREVALELLERHDRMITRSAELQRALTASPDDEAIKPLADERDRRRADVAERHREQARIQGELDALEQRISAVSRELDRKTQARRAVQLANADIDRFVLHTGRARGTLQTFRAKLIEQHVHRIEGLVLEGFARLLRKERMVSSVRIDPTSCELTLFDRNEKEWTMERLSAGERQLLATSILWGLARAARRPLPVVIDTPLGRLDSDHRRHFVEGYLPWASHQVIVLSTDEEIDESHLERLRRRIGHSYRLDHDDETGQTTIAEGYFWGEPTHAS